MLGMDMMMKSMGINPDEIKAQIEKATLIAQEKVAQMEAQLNRIEQNQLLLYQLMSRKGLIETVEEYNENVAAEKARESIPMIGEINGRGKSN
jgi:hypothetical protein